MKMASNESEVTINDVFTIQTLTKVDCRKSLIFLILQNRGFSRFLVPYCLRGKHVKSYSKCMGKVENLMTNNSGKFRVPKCL